MSRQRFYTSTMKLRPLCTKREMEHLGSPHKVERSEKHDAYYCGPCNVWLEETCKKRGYTFKCVFCEGRPKHPKELLS